MNFVAENFREESSLPFLSMEDNINLHSFITIGKGV